MNHLDVRGVLWVNDYMAAWTANKEVNCFYFNHGDSWIRIINEVFSFQTLCLIEARLPLNNFSFHIFKPK